MSVNARSNSPCFMLTGFLAAEKTKLISTIRKLNGIHVYDPADSQAFLPGCTHVIAKKPSRSLKFLSAVASGKWLLVDKYVTDSEEAGHWLQEEEYEWGETYALAAATTSEMLKAPKRWRLSLSRKTVKPPFYEWRVGLAVSKLFQVYKRLIEIGGGTAGKIKDQRAETFTHVLVEEDLKENVRSFHVRGIPCLRCSYLAQCILQDPPPPASACSVFVASTDCYVRLDKCDPLLSPGTLDLLKNGVPITRSSPKSDSDQDTQIGLRRSHSGEGRRFRFQSRAFNFNLQIPVIDSSSTSSEEDTHARATSRPMFDRTQKGVSQSNSDVMIAESVTPPLFPSPRKALSRDKVKVATKRRSLSPGPSWRHRREDDQSCTSQQKQGGTLSYREYWRQKTSRAPRSAATIDISDTSLRHVQFIARADVSMSREVSSSAAAPGTTTNKTDPSQLNKEARNITSHKSKLPATVPAPSQFESRKPKSIHPPARSQANNAKGGRLLVATAELAVKRLPDTSHNRQSIPYCKSQSTLSQLRKATSDKGPVMGARKPGTGASEPVRRTLDMGSMDKQRTTLLREKISTALSAKISGKTTSTVSTSSADGARDVIGPNLSQLDRAASRDGNRTAINDRNLSPALHHDSHSSDDCMPLGSSQGDESTLPLGLREYARPPVEPDEQEIMDVDQPSAELIQALDIANGKADLPGTDKAAIGVSSSLTADVIPSPADKPEPGASKKTRPLSDAASDTRKKVFVFDQKHVKPLSPFTTLASGKLEAVCLAKVNVVLKSTEGTIPGSTHKTAKGTSVEKPKCDTTTPAFGAVSVAPGDTVSEPMEIDDAFPATTSGVTSTTASTAAHAADDKKTSTSGTLHVPARDIGSRDSSAADVEMIHESVSQSLAPDSTTQCREHETAAAVLTTSTSATGDLQTAPDKHRNLGAFDKEISDGSASSPGEPKAVSESNAVVEAAVSSTTNDISQVSVQPEAATGDTSNPLVPQSPPSDLGVAIVTDGSLGTMDGPLGEMDDDSFPRVPRWLREKRHLLRAVFDKIRLHRQPANEPIIIDPDSPDSRTSAVRFGKPEMSMAESFAAAKHSQSVLYVCGKFLCPAAYPPPDLLFLVMREYLLDSQNSNEASNAISFLNATFLLHPPTSKHIKKDDIYQKAMATTFATESSLFASAKLKLHTGVFHWDKPKQESAEWCFFSIVVRQAMEASDVERRYRAVALLAFLTNAIENDDNLIRCMFWPRASHFLLTSAVKLLFKRLFKAMEMMSSATEVAPIDLDVDFVCEQVQNLDSDSDDDDAGESDGESSFEGEALRSDVLTYLVRVVTSLCRFLHANSRATDALEPLGVALVKVFADADHVTLDRLFTLLPSSLTMVACRAMLERNCRTGLAEVGPDADLSMNAIVKRYLRLVPKPPNTVLSSGTPSASTNGPPSSVDVHSDHSDKENLQTMDKTHLSQSPLGPGSRLNSATINKRNQKGETYLHRACIANNPERVAQLLTVPGVDPNARDHVGWTPLSEACIQGNLACVQELLRLPVASTPSTAPAEASSTAPAVAIDLLACPPEGTTPLHDALENSHIEVARLLVEKGGVELLYVVDQKGRTPLDVCSNDVVRSLILEIACHIAANNFESKGRVEVEMPASPPKVVLSRPTDEEYMTVLPPPSLVATSAWRNACLVYVVILHHLIVSYVMESGLFDAISLLRKAEATSMHSESSPRFSGYGDIRQVEGDLASVLDWKVVESALLAHVRKATGDEAFTLPNQYRVLMDFELANLSDTLELSKDGEGEGRYLVID